MKNVKQYTNEEIFKINLRITNFLKTFNDENAAAMAMFITSLQLVQKIYGAEAVQEIYLDLMDVIDRGIEN